MGLTSSGDACEIMSCKDEAKKVVEDSNEYFASGHLSVLMLQKVKNVQETQDLSEEDTVDFLMTKAQEYLNK